MCAVAEDVQASEPNEITQEAEADEEESTNPDGGLPSSDAPSSPGENEVVEDSGAEDEANTGETQQGDKQDEEAPSEGAEEDSGFEGDAETEGEGQLTSDDESSVAPLAAAPSSTLAVRAASVVETVGGETRYETSAQQAKYAFSSSTWAIVTTGEGYADAIGAAGLAGALKCPIVLTTPRSLSKSASSTLSSLGVSQVILLGGNDAVSASVESQLRSVVGSKGSVVRLGGATRYETQMEVYKWGKARGLWKGDVAVVATGANFADALSISPLSYKLSAPVFFVNESGSLPSSQLSSIRSCGKSTFLIAGGPVVVSTKVDSTLSGLGKVERLSGATRYETSVKIAQYAVSSLGMSWEGTAFSSGENPYDALGGGAVQGAQGSVLVLKKSPDTSLPWGSARPSRITFFGGKDVFSSAYKVLVAIKGGWAPTAVQGVSYKDAGNGWVQIDGAYCLRSGNNFLTGWQKKDGSWYYLNPTTYARMTGWITVGGVPYHLDSNGRYIASHSHNIAWAGQPNNYYCGPASGYMILRNVGATRSASGTSLNVYNVASYMGTTTSGTNFATRAFANGMNRWLGKNVYTTVHTPSYATVRNAIMNSFRNGYASAVDTQERYGGPHLNGHSNSTFSHIMVVDSYNQDNDTVTIVDPGAGTVWSGSAQKFSVNLNYLVTQFMQKEVFFDREHIGLHYAR